MDIQISGILRHSFVNGPGSRFVVFFQGCPHNCKGCHNRETHDPHGGQNTTTEEIIQLLVATKHLDGITLSGGDPLMQAPAAIEISDAARRSGLTVWVYTGWTFDEIMAGQVSDAAIELMQHIDVLVDGPYIEALHTGNETQDCIWRGSKNQRLINIPASIKGKDIICLEGA